MNQNSQLEEPLGELEESLGNFAIAVKRLHERPLLEENLLARYLLEGALGATLASSRALGHIESSEEELKNREDSFGYATKYRGLAYLCLREFQEMMPRLDGQKIKVALFSEQVGGRIELIDEMYPARN